MEYSNSQVVEIIKEYLHSDLEQGVMIQRLTKKLTIEQLSEMFDVSVSTVKRIIGRCSEEIFRHVPG